MSIVKNGKTLLTYSDYSLIPDDGRRHEILGGIHFVTPSPNDKHQRILLGIATQLFLQIGRTGRGEVRTAPLDVVLSATDILQPDIFVVRAKRRHIITPENVRGAPDLVIEITSPSTRDRDLRLRRSLYAAHGVPEYWIVHARENVVEKLLLGTRGYRRAGRFRRQVNFDGLSCVIVDLTEVW